MAAHCAITVNDAICTYKLGVVSTGAHSDAAKLLRSQYPSKDAKSKSVQLSQILDRKNLVEYEDRAFHEKDAKQILLLAERFYKWAKTELP